METTRFRSYAPDQLLLLPPDLREWLPEGHAAYFMLDILGELDLSEIYASYDGSKGGRPGFDPRLLTVCCCTVTAKAWRAEDAQYGQGRRGDDLPDELRFRRRRLEKIRQAKAALEAEARAEAQGKSEAKSTDDAEALAEGSVEPKLPAEKAQRNFTDPDSRIMRDGATKSFEQSYNCQAAVDDQAQVIVVQVTQKANDNNRSSR